MEEIGPIQSKAEISRIIVRALHSRSLLGYLIDTLYEPTEYPLRRLYDGTIVKTKSKAISGYISGIYDFDVNVGGDIDSPCCAVILDGEEKDRGSEEMGFRVAGRKWM